jgi:predicted transcriptional regulator
LDKRFKQIDDDQVTQNNKINDHASRILPLENQLKELLATNATLGSRIDELVKATKAQSRIKPVTVPTGGKVDTDAIMSII